MSVKFWICAKAGAAILVCQPQQRMSYTVGGQRWDEHGHSMRVPGLMPQHLAARWCQSR